MAPALTINARDFLYRNTHPLTGPIKQFCPALSNNYVSALHTRFPKLETVQIGRLQRLARAHADN